MKKKMLPLLAAILTIAISLACAEAPAPETREERILLEGTEETIITTRVETYRGYSLWIDTGFLTLIPEIEGLGMDLFRRSDIEDTRYEVAIYYGGWLGYTFEEDAETTLQILRDNYEAADAFDIGDTFGELPACGFRATDGGMVYLHYLVGAEEGAFNISVSFPREAAEGFGARVEQMLGSFEVIPSETVGMP